MKKPNFIKVSVSLPPEVHDWLKSEADRRTQKFGESWTASRVLQEALREYRARQSASATLGQAMPDLPHHLGKVSAQPHSGPEIIAPHKTSTKQPVGGRSTAMKSRSRKNG